MFSIKSLIFFLALVSLMVELRAQEWEPHEEEREASTEEQMNEMESSGESEESTQTSTDSESEERTETIAILFEEMDENTQTSSPSIQLSTESEDTITSQYNGFDSDESAAELAKGFSCFGRSFGQYADVDTECHRFHLCYPFFNTSNDELLYQRITFECNEDSVFDQKRFICAENSTIDHKCSESVALYDRTNQEYLIRVFSQSVSPIDEVNGQQTSGSESEPSEGAANPGWFNWLYRG